MGLTHLLVGVAVVLGAFVKGTTGMGFPLIATPMVALVVDIRTTYALLLPSNILMDVLQVGRDGLPWALWRRLAVSLVAVVPGVFLGTRILVAVRDWAVHLALAATILAFLGFEHLAVQLRIPRARQRWVGPAMGLVAGVLTGVTNVLGPLVAIYLLAVDMTKRDFVKAMASVVLVAKCSQLVAISRWGLYSAPILGWSALLTLLAVAGFRLGLRLQDRVSPHVFRAILQALLLAMALFFIARGVAG